MPHKDPEAARVYRRERRAKLRLNPEWVEKRNAAERARYERRTADPTYRGGANQKAAKWRADNPEKWRAAQRRMNLKRYYGITLEQYEKLLGDQGGACAICCGAEPKKALAVDHCHKTGRVRGLLCGSCNLAIGKFRDNPALLQAAILYLRE